MSDSTSQAGGNTSTTAGSQPVAGATDAGAGAPAAAPAAAAPAASQQSTAGQPAAPAPAPAAAAAPGAPGAPVEGGAAAPAAPVVPDKYELTAPEGVQLDPEATAAFSEFAKGLKLSQDDAQKAFDKLSATSAAQTVKAVSQAIERTSTEWRAATQADPEIGGEKLTENLAVATRAVERFATPELRALLQPFHPKDNPKGGGLGNHPEVIRLFHRIGKAIKEDGFVPGGSQPTKGERSAAEVLYGQPNR